MIYETSHIKRHRATQAEVEERREALYNIVASIRPMTVRQVFYQATVRGIVDKTEAGYAKVQTDLVIMRKAGELAGPRRRRPTSARAHGSKAMRARAG